MTAPRVAPLLQKFFLERLLRERGASPHTVASYRDTFRLLLVFAASPQRPTRRLRPSRHHLWIELPARPSSRHRRAGDADDAFDPRLHQPHRSCRRRLDRRSPQETSPATASSQDSTRAPRRPVHPAAAASDGPSDLPLRRRRRHSPRTSSARDAGPVAPAVPAVHRRRRVPPIPDRRPGTDPWSPPRGSGSCRGRTAPRPAPRSGGRRPPIAPAPAARGSSSR